MFSAVITGKSTKCSYKPSGVSATEDLISVVPSKTKMASLLRTEDGILGWWREYFKDLLKRVPLTPSDLQNVHCGKENTITASDVFFDVKTLKGWKAAGCDEIRPEMIKSIEEISDDSLSVSWPDVVERHRKIGKLGDNQHTQEIGQENTH